MKKTWTEKLERAAERKIVPIPPKMQKQLGEGTLLIPRPLDVDALIREIPEGGLITLGEIRSVLAREFGASTTCAMVTGMFVRIAAEAAAEKERSGETRVTPYWRVVRDDGTLLEKLPGGVAEQARRLRAEGHRPVESGRLRKTYAVRVEGRG